MAVADKSLIARRFNRAFISYDQQAQVQRIMNDKLIDLLSPLGQLRLQHILEVGCGTGLLTRRLLAHIEAERWTINDLCNMEKWIANLFPMANYCFCCGDAEEIRFSEKFDLIASGATVQWFEQPERFLKKCVKCLTDNGLILLSSFAPSTLYEIKSITNIGLNYPMLEDWRKWLDRDFDILHLDQQHICINFQSPIAVLKHLKQTGVTGVRKEYWGKHQLQQFIQQYQQKYTTRYGEVHLTYSPIFILARKRTIYEG